MKAAFRCPPRVDPTLHAFFHKTNLQSDGHAVTN
jgi:hypothetical protein